MNNPQKIHYSQIADVYDKVFPTSGQSVERVLTFLVEQVGCDKQVKLLDLGCGTGRFAIPIATRLGFVVTAADTSSDMLAKARSKQGAENITWDIQDATALSYDNEQFDVVLMSHLLHHFEHPQQVIRECRRILAPGGILLNRYGAIEDILDDPEHKFFPEVAELDKLRTPSKHRLEQWFKELSFLGVQTETRAQETFLDAEHRLKAIQSRHVSVLRLISDSAFDAGVARMKSHIASNPNDNSLSIDRISFTFGRKKQP